jgi:hypothetical protein
MTPCSLLEIDVSEDFAAPLSGKKGPLVVPSETIVTLYCTGTHGVTQNKTFYISYGKYNLSKC